MALIPVRGLAECDDVSGITLGQFAFDIHGPFFLYWPSWSFRDHVNHPTINQYTCLNENYAKKDSLPSNDGGPDDQCDRPESTNADSAFPSG